MKSMNNQQGQTAVEYILLILVTLLLAISIMIRVRDWMLPDGGECREGDTNLVCAFERLYNVGNLKYYRMPR
jgi:hypothetical protein